MISYATKLLGTPEALRDLKTLLEMHRDAFNFAAKEQFGEAKNSIVVLHSKVYKKFRELNPKIPAQIVIRGEQECLDAHRSIKSNKHKITKPIEKKRLSMRLDKRLYSRKDYGLRITTANKRQDFQFVLYKKLKSLLDNYTYKDPLLFIKNDIIYISFCFDIPTEKFKQKQCLGVDLGICRSAAMSDGRIVIDRKFNGDKRKLRYLKRSLQSKGTKSAKRHLKQLRHKERNKNKNQTHLIANEILKTNADTIVLENLKSIKVKKHKYQNKNRISQVPLAELRRVITYKAELQGKTVILVCPSYTSQTDSVTGKREGTRKGCRFYAENGLVYDADVNAAVNIGKRSKLPVSQGNLLDGQAVVNQPNVCKSILHK